MGSRAYNTVVVLFWIGTMSWLVVAKVLPPLRVGDPPNYRSILSQSKLHPSVCWSIHLNEAPVGWAASRIVRTSGGNTGAA